MKKHTKKLFFLFVLFFISGSTNAQNADSLGMIGDNLDLHAILEAFKNAISVEDFEKTINSPISKINNLDLDEDGQIDYIRVIDNAEKEAHALILRMDLSSEESQDIAAIELEKTGESNVTIQLIGEEELYGKDYIVEPVNTVEAGNSPPAFVLVNVWGWSCVKFIYAPTYKPWRSPWRYKKHPAYWKPWKPYRWSTYHGFHKHHHHRYHVVHVHRTGHAHQIYHKHKKGWKHIKRHKHHHNHQSHHNGHTNGHKKHGHKKHGQKKGHKKHHKHGH